MHANSSGEHAREMHMIIIYTWFLHYACVRFYFNAGVRCVRFKLRARTVRFKLSARALRSFNALINCACMRAICVLRLRAFQ